MRLIDADALSEVLNVKENCEDCDYQHGMFCSKNSDFVTACEAIFDAPTIESEPHWIPFSERLPEKNGDYLCSLGDDAHSIEVDTFTDDHFEIYNVIAWMPLPESYSGE